jgi:hypothetical protein
MFSTLFKHPQSSSVAGAYSFGWLLFLSAKADMLTAHSTDVVHLLNVLLCCINLLYVLSPSEKRKRQLGAGAFSLSLSLLTLLLNMSYEADLVSRW